MNDIDNCTKLHYYDILNSVITKVKKIEDPFNILSSNVLPTYKTIELKYLKNKNYFYDKNKVQIPIIKKTKGGNREKNITVYF